MNSILSRKEELNRMVEVALLKKKKEIEGIVGRFYSYQ
jgi:hypothetical protein